MEEELSNFVHDLFLDKEYLAWRSGLKSETEHQWHSLVASLDRAGAPLDRIQGLGESVYRKFVFSYLPAPDYKKSGMLMVLFTVSESLWHSVIWHNLA